MIKVHRSTGTGLAPVESRAKDCWIDVTDPTQEEARQLAGDLAIPAEFVRYSLTPTKIPLVGEDDDALLVLVRIPRFLGEDARTPYASSPLGIVVTSQSVVGGHDLRASLRAVPGPAP